MDFGNLKMYINGELTSSHNTMTKDIISPLNDEKIATLAWGSSNDSIRALESAKEGFKVWSNTSINKRKEWMLLIREKILENEEILRKLRSLSNWPGGWTYHNQNRIRIHEAKKIEFSVGKENIKPGEFIGYSGNGSPIIQCGSNSFLEITQIQKEGKKKMNSQDFLRGYKINIGDKFRRNKM